MNDIHCDGSEETLLECSLSNFGTHISVNHQSLQVTCLRKLNALCLNFYWKVLFVYNYTYDTAIECYDFDVRLLGERNHTEGRVEVCLEGLWSTVYANFWDARDANVVCQQLGHTECKLTVTL